MERVENRPVRVFDEGVVRFLGDLSAALFRSMLVRQFPDLSAFAFYIRRANLQKLRDSLFPPPEDGGENPELGRRMGRGLCFHVTPANVPVNFAFSWAFSLLAGNANIVRLPSKAFPQVDALLTEIRTHLESVPELARRNAFVRYPRTDMGTTAAYSLLADCRMIWGGDATIASLRALPTKPRCVDATFADRYSVAMIDGNAVQAADETRLARLAEGFYNDTYLMDQNACSSPNLILWEHDSTAARERFWGAVEEIAQRKYALQDALAVDKYTLLCEEAIKNPSTGEVHRGGNLLYRVEWTDLPEDLCEHRGKGGFFFEYSLEDREKLFARVTEKIQTVTQFGIDENKLLRQILDRGLHGIDRIVPVGHAMDIGALWDGHDLIRMLSRRVETGGK